MVKIKMSEVESMMDNLKIGDVVRVKHFKHGEIMRQIRGIDWKYYAIRADDGRVYMLSSEKDERGVFFF